ncbi:sensor histidine kinase [Cellulomonas sp. P22]|uniref:sensor histidine kinase n=1 Tax=Cellulomonas sp. P22 TaxID=3373189 RepID=UPI0037983ACD
MRRWFWRHPVASDWLVALSFALMGTHTLNAAIVEGTSPLLTAFLMYSGALTLLFRRRRPVIVLGAVVALGVLTLGVTTSLAGYEIAIALALYAVAAARPARVTWTAMGISLALITLGVALLAPTQTRSAEVLSYAMLALIGVSIGTSVRNRRQHVAELVRRGNALARETEQSAQLATVTERARIAREMHDVVAHSLSVMIALADGASASLDRSPARARTAIDELSETGRAALADMRRVLGVLREDDAALGPTPGEHDLDELVDRYRLAGLGVQVTLTGEPLPPDTGLQLVVYRIVQESLTNVLRHAQGANASLTIARTRTTVVVEVVDDGGVGSSSAAPTAPGSGRGVVGMRERATIFAGTVDAGPHGAGWRVRAVIPWETSTRDEGSSA